MRLNRLASVFVLALAAVGAPAHAQRSTPVQVLHPSGTGGDLFGQAVAIDGDTMIVGAAYDDVGGSTDQGTAHVYRWTGSGWTLEATLTAADGAASDAFGFSVAISGDTAIVGAPYDDVGANSDQGSACIFTRSGTTWTQQPKLSASDGAANDYFGYSVALSGDTAVVGASFDDIGANVNQGSAYAFVRASGGTTWAQQAKLTAATGTSSDALGTAVALSGDTAIVGAVGFDMGPTTNAGAAFVFVRAGTSWTQQAQLSAASATQDNFGISVAVSGDTAIVGAYGDDVGANVSQGSAHVYVRSGTTWTQQAQLNAADGATNDYFGVSVALSGDTAVVGAFYDDVGANADQGSAYAFVRSGTTWTQRALFTSSSGAASDDFGAAVALSGDTVLIGANYDDVGANSDQGSAWVFSRVGSKWIGPDLSLIAPDGAGSDYFGMSVAISGDTAIVGAVYDDIGANGDQGSAYVYVRSGTVWTQQAKLTASDGAGSDYFGMSVAISGDTAIVGASGDDVGANANQGSAYVFVRSGTTWTQQAKLVASDGAASDSLGYSVALSGDTALTGAVSDDVGANANQGSAYVFVRSGTTWTQQARLSASDGAANDQFGFAVAGSSDTAIIGANADDVGANADQGSAYVFVRSGTTWTQQAKLTASDGAAIDVFGSSVALSGETAIVSAYADDVGVNSDQGSAYVFVRSGTAWSQQAKLTASDGGPGDYFGMSVAIGGDTSLVGADYADLGAALDQGTAYAFVRAPGGSGWIQQAKLSASDGASGDNLGYAIGVSGGTAIVGAIRDDIGANTDRGSAWVFDVPAGDFALAHNDSTGVSYTTLAAALSPALSGQQITASDAAWRGIGVVDTLGRSLFLQSTGDLRTPSTSTIALGGGSALLAPSGGSVEINGQVRAAAGASADVYADNFLLGSRGILAVRSTGSLNFNVPQSRTVGQTRTETGAYLTFNGTLENAGPASLSDATTLTTSGTLTNCDVLSLSSGSINTPLLVNIAQANFFGTSPIFGSFTNGGGAVTTIRSGTLFVFGSLTNNGTIVGTICSNCLSGPPNLDIGWSLVLGPAANLSMPFSGSLVHVGGAFDCAITSSTRYDMSLATLQLEGTGGEQTLEVMSTDIGADALGLDRTLAGHYPIHTLEIGPAPSTVRLVDAHDNDTLGQFSCETIYVDTLRIDAGCRLINPSCRVYYNTLVSNGTVDVPANLIAIGSAPGCDSIDFNGDGLFPDTADIDDFLSVFSGGPCSTDTCGDIDFNNDGLFPDTLDIDSLLSVFSGGPCL